jgi:hypothetical protein|tara:strand:- start:306 stop:506 length:201 start_codon:yes stop_codon:yes gene_type:complete
MDPVIDYLRKQLTQRKEDLADVVSSGSSTDYSEYKYQVGIIEGLTIAIEELKLAEKNLHNEGEEEE